MKTRQTHVNASAAALAIVVGTILPVVAAAAIAATCMIGGML
jgi:hypothetical protein